VAAIIHQLAATYEVTPAQAHQAVVDLVAALTAAKLITLAGDE
jgi:hypothetical protein